MKRKHGKLLPALLSAGLVLATVTTVCMTALFPSAAVSRVNVSNLLNAPEHDFQFVNSNCNWNNITNNFTDFATNFDFGDGFNFSYNVRAFNNNDYFCAGIFYDARMLRKGENRLSTGVTFCIPNGVMGHTPAGALKYYDLKVRLSGFNIASQSDRISVNARPSDFGQFPRDCKNMTADTTGWYASHMFGILHSTSYGTSAPVVPGQPHPNRTLWMHTLNPVSPYIGLPGYDYYGLACDITISVLEHTNNWRTAPVVSGTIPMAWNDIDQPDLYTHYKTYWAKGSNTQAAAAYAAWDTDKNYWGHPSDNFGEFTLYQGPFSEAVELKSGCGDIAGGNHQIYTKSGFTCGVDGNRIIGSGDDNTVLSGDARSGFVYLANAASSTARWSATGAGTQLFMDIGVYNLTIERTDSYGFAAGTVTNGTVTGGKYQGTVTAFPNDTWSLRATASDGYYIKSVSVDGVSKTVMDDKDMSFSFSNITANHNVKVELAPYKKITTSVTNGSITNTVSDLKPGANQTVSYSPDSGYYLESVTVDGSPVSIMSYQGSYTFSNIQEDHSISVVYAPYRSIATEIEHGTVTPDIQSIKKGESRTVAWRADDGYFVSSVTVDGRDIPVTDFYSGNYVFGNIDGDHRIKIVCEPLAEVTVVPSSGSISITDGNSLYHFSGLRYEVRNAAGNTVASAVMPDHGTSVTVENLLPGDYTIVSVDDNGPYLRSMDIGSVHLDAGGHADVVLLHPAVSDSGTIHVDKNWSDRE